MDKIVNLFMLPLVCEAITEIVGGSDLLKTPREYIIERKIPFFSKLFGCKYCLSVWVSMFVVLCWFLVNLQPFSIQRIMELIMMVFIVHRLSNLYHLLMDIIGDYRRERWLVPYIPGKEERSNGN